VAFVSPVLGAAVAVSIVAACTLSLDGYDNGVCPAGHKACFRKCVPITSTDTGCAAADCSKCDIQGAAAVCDNSGACAIGICLPDLADCDHDSSNGCEADLYNEIHNCGTCGNSCPAAAGHMVPVCTAGTCHTKCAPGYASCGQPCDTLIWAPENCGGCNNTCAGTCPMGTCIEDAGTD
jgi:hypothetical protein